MSPLLTKQIFHLPRFVAPHSVRISGRDPYKENSTINGSLVATWEFLLFILMTSGGIFEPLLNKETSFFFGVGSWKDSGNFRQFIRVKLVKHWNISLFVYMAKVRVEDFGQGSFMAFGESCWAMLVLTIHPDRTQLVVSVQAIMNSWRLWRENLLTKRRVKG